ncbi:ABC transporter ATP-binding protein [Paenibacillus ginsengihumi]|uniref:ABC transporter ATP-binding protein n=1 Tax=Paenibacillus ginsengihumi TaxID=431596 RepID=UPI00035C57AF|nr:ABC transporter ATP-binding protein [Paenibacillus ginsengihumi]
MSGFASLAGAASGVASVRLKFPGSPELMFEDLTLQVRPGEKVLLIGPSGCGKSTLLQVLSGLIPQAMEVPVKYDEIVIPERWGYLFQDPDAQFCMPYVDEEIAFVLENMGVPREEMADRIRKCLDRVGLHLDDVHLPIAALSQGMKQRLAIASLLALEPDVWFLDEPTSLLDPQGTSDVWETLREVTKDDTVIIVEHKIEEVATFVDRVVMFSPNGRVLADGKPADVFRERRAELQEYGIWYPGVWADYIAGPRYRALRRMADRKLADERGSEKSLAGAAARQPLVRLRDFAGMRGKETKIEMPLADIRTGDWIAVVGPNGAGKSTLLLSLMQLIQTRGEYTLLGRPVQGFDDCADHLSYVFQNPEMQFVAHSVYDEIAFNFRRDGETEEAVRAKTDDLLVWFGLEHHRALHPYQLSLGQKRRLSVAAATVKAQALLLLDEPTFGQDAANTFALLEKLEAWRQEGTAIVMVTHDPELVRHFATKVWEIRHGRLEAVMSPEEYAADLELLHGYRFAELPAAELSEERASELPEEPATVPDGQAEERAALARLPEVKSG